VWNIRADKMRLLNFFTVISLITICLNHGITQQHDHENHAERIESDADKERFYWQMPNRVIEEIGIEQGMVVADVGSGNGYFTLRIANQVGSTGKVYASDIDKHALQILEENASEAGFQNIGIISGREDNPLLPVGKIDLVLMVNVIHLIDDIKTFLANIRPSLTENGVLIIVQWDAEKMDFELSDWDESNRELFTMRTTLRKIYDSNYEVFKMKTFLPMQNIYFCKPRKINK
jgi:ubiquinone/menaquinone biosynthesis C-methylase UbiE